MAINNVDFNVHQDSGNTSCSLEFDDSNSSNLDTAAQEHIEEYIKNELHDNSNPSYDYKITPEKDA